MNYKKYREEKINKYADHRTGILMYKHEKLFDIVTTIEEFINFSITGEPSIDEYKNFTEQLMNKLPHKYKDTQYKKYNQVIEDYNTTKQFIKLKKIIYLLQLIINDIIIVILTHNSETGLTYKISRYGPCIVLKKILMQDMGHYETGTNKLTISNNLQEEDSTIEHEFLHYINNQGLLEENEIITEHIKNEFLAQILDPIINKNIEENNIEEINKFKEHMISFYLLDFIFNITDGNIKNQKTIEIKNENKNIDLYISQKKIISLTKDNNQINYHIPLEKITKSRQNIINIFIQGINLINKIIKIYQLISQNNGYYNQKQLIYLLSFTPFSKRQSILEYYTKLDSIYKNKKNLYSILTND